MTIEEGMEIVYKTTNRLFQVYVERYIVSTSLCLPFQILVIPRYEIVHRDLIPPNFYFSNAMTAFLLRLDSNSTRQDTLRLNADQYLRTGTLVSTRSVIPIFSLPPNLRAQRRHDRFFLLAVRASLMTISFSVLYAFFFIHSSFPA